MKREKTDSRERMEVWRDSGGSGSREEAEQDKLESFPCSLPCLRLREHNRRLLDGADALEEAAHLCSKPKLRFTSGPNTNQFAHDGGSFAT
jgi:hypothetical protein